jgi:hypothetical protein
MYYAVFSVFEYLSFDFKHKICLHAYVIYKYGMIFSIQKTLETCVVIKAM